MRTRFAIAAAFSGFCLLGACGKVAQVPIYVVLPQSDVPGVPAVLEGDPALGIPAVKSLRVSVRAGTPGGADMTVLSSHVQDFDPSVTNSLSIHGLTGGRQRYVVLEGLAETAAQIRNGQTPTILVRGVSAPEDYLAPGQAEPQGKKYPPVTLFLGRVGRFEPLRAGLSDARAFFGTANLGKGRFAFAGGVGWDDSLARAIALPSVEVFDATGFGFERMPADLASPRAFPAMIELPGGGALLAGGVANPAFDESAVQTAEFLDRSGNPTGETPAAIARVFATATSFRKDGIPHVLLAGGSASLDLSTPDNTLQELVSHSLVSDLQSLDAKRACFTATELSDGRVLFAGGYARVPVFGQNEQIGATANAELFDTTAPPNHTDVATPMNAPRWGHTATLLDDGTVLLVGGATGNPAPGGLAATTGSFDLFLPTTPVGPAFRFNWPPGRGTTPRAHHAAVKLTTGEVLVSGGASSAGAFVAGSNGALAISCAALYQPRVGAFRAARPMIIPRYGHATVTLPGGQVLVVGGYGADGRPEATAEVYTPCWSDAECDAVYATDPLPALPECP